MGFKTLPSRISDAVLTVANVAALSTISAPQEGDERHVSDIDVIYVYTGSAWAPAASSSTAPVLPSTGGTGISNNDSATLTRSGSHALTITTTGTTGVTLPTSGTLGAVPAAGVVTSSGTALTSEAALSPARGGTGVANDAAATLTRSGNHAVTITTTGATGVTLPTTGTLAATVTTTRGDLIRRGVSGDERLVAVTDNRVVRGDGTDVILGQIDDPDFFTAGAAGGSSIPGIVSGTAQAWSGVKTFNDGLAAPTTAAGNVHSGTYTPTIVNGTNVTAHTAFLCQFLRVGAVVTVSGKVNIDADLNAACDWTMTVPVASTFTTNEDAGGTAAMIGTQGIAAIYGVAGTVVTFNGYSTSASNSTWMFSFTYRIK